MNNESPKSRARVRDSAFIKDAKISHSVRKKKAKSNLKSRNSRQLSKGFTPVLGMTPEVSPAHNTSIMTYQQNKNFKREAI